jgi:peptide/nickel transport system substrate-binding protein
MRPKSRLLFVTLAVVFAMLLGVVAGPMNGNVAKAEGKTLTVAFAQEPDVLNAYYTNMAFAQWVWFLTESSLWDYDNHLKPVPVLVTEIPTAANGGISKDGKTLTIHLKKDLKWSDGQPLTTDDVAFTFQMLLDKANNFTVAPTIADQIVSMDNVKVVDAQTLSITTKDPQYPENMFGVGNFYLLPKHVFADVYAKDKTLEKADFNQNPTVFSGPYVLKEWKRGTSLTFEPNPNYALGKAKIDQVVIRIFPDPESGNAAFVAGDIDLLVNLQVGEIIKLQEQTKDGTHVGIYGSYREGIWVNMRGEDLPKAGHPALKQKEVRQAIRMGINRKGLIHDLLKDIESPADSMWADTPFVNPNLKYAEYDPAGAEKLLDAAGWVKGADGVRESKGVKDVKDGTKLELNYGSTTAAQRKANQAVIQQDLAKIGIKITIKNYDPTQFFGAFADGGIAKTGVDDLDEYANNTVTTNPANVRTFECNNITSEKNPGGQNYIGYCNPEFDKLQIATENATDAKAGLAAAFKAQEILQDEVPMIILYSRLDHYMYKTSKFTAAPNIGAGITNQWYDIVNWDVK